MEHSTRQGSSVGIRPCVPVRDGARRARNMAMPLYVLFWVDDAEYSTYNCISSSLQFSHSKLQRLVNFLDTSSGLDF